MGVSAGETWIEIKTKRSPEFPHLRSALAAREESGPFKPMEFGLAGRRNTRGGIFTVNRESALSRTRPRDRHVTLSIRTELLAGETWIEIRTKRFQAFPRSRSPWEEIQGSGPFRPMVCGPAGHRSTVAGISTAKRRIPSLRIRRQIRHAISSNPEGAPAGETSIRIRMSIFQASQAVRSALAESPNRSAASQSSVDPA